MAAVTIDYVADWATRLRSRLYTQFRNKVTWELWITEVLAPQFQDLEDSAQTLLTLLDIDNSEGVQLDRIGRLVGQPRLGTVDETYKLYLHARVAANASTGTPEDLYRVFRALLGTAVTLVITTYPFKSFLLRIGGAITATQGAVAATFLRAAKESGARAALEWEESSDGAVFHYDIGPGYDVGRLGGAVTT